MADSDLRGMTLSLEDLRRAKLANQLAAKRLALFLEQQRLITQQFASLLAAQRNLPKFALPTPAWVIEVQKQAQQIASMGRSIADAQSRAFAPYRPLFAAMKVQRDRCDRLAAAGWLPHSTTPFNLVDSNDGSDSEALASALEAWYVEHWTDVEAVFHERLATYNIDDEARSAFGEALKAHGYGLFRTTSRTLFPEIERLTRMEFHDGSPASLASQEELRKAAEDLFPSDFEPVGLYGLALFKRFIDHMYAHARTHETVAALATDPVPNRHAVVHGLLPYASALSSINALIMADFVFQIVSALKARVEDDASEAA